MARRKDPVAYYQGRLSDEVLAITETAAQQSAAEESEAAISKSQNP